MAIPTISPTDCKRVQQEQGRENQFHTFYRYFLLKLFHEGLSQREMHAPELEALLGKVPYLNGGLFDVHVLERANPEITIPDEAFEQLFAFLNEFDWYLDDRPLRSDREINPDVLGLHLREVYQPEADGGLLYQRGHHRVHQQEHHPSFPPRCRRTESARSPSAPMGQSGRCCAKTPTPISMMPSRKGAICHCRTKSRWVCMTWRSAASGTEPAPEAYALPTETWREVVARRARYQDVRAKLAAGEITSANDLITYNLDSRRFAEDVITYCDGHRPAAGAVR